MTGKPVTGLMLAYFAGAAWLLLCWMPKFFELNAGTDAHSGFRFIAASGLPLALLLLAAAFRQANRAKLALGTLIEVGVAVWLLVWALSMLYEARPSTVLSFAHVGLCVLFIPWMLFRAVVPEPAGSE
jgi:hypothetical protein